MIPRKTFASDNYSGVHPSIMEGLLKANVGHAASYGADQWTRNAIEKFESYFGKSIDVYFVYNGTGANVSGLRAITQSYNAIICSDLAHINVDESTAPEGFTGCKLITIPTTDGKIYPHQIEARIQRLDDPHHPQVKVISISQVTEYGTVYSVKEIAAIAEVARKHNILLHMDGSRICNAAVSLGRDFKEFTHDVGVDVLSFGGTKNGMMFGEAVIFFNTSYSVPFKFIRKQSMQLHSKMRFIGAQFEALLSDELWKINASHSNAMAKLLEGKLRKLTSLKITQKVDANSIFMILPSAVTQKMQDEFFFYVWNEHTSEVRLMCAFDTTAEDVELFTERLSRILNGT
ncbi:MAG TPA: low specificity L-threonine aldolase [Cyclobacteriaceae bacterium]|nr:low specificity L-threonine aldolase [Cyclobacteriaceae bacterium]